tara:strand:+ start:254 stop:520 length:267 start_codon:yes stop_codon:yes gene_type:complete
MATKISKISVNPNPNIGYLPNLSNLATNKDVKNNIIKGNATIVCVIISGGVIRADKIKTKTIIMRELLNKKDRDKSFNASNTHNKTGI